MAVQAGWVGSSAKAETGKEWMGDARVALRLPKAGWMSEMIGKSTEVLFINTVNRTQANIHALMGSPTVPNIYIFENHAIISAATQSGWALQTGTFPAGSTLKIINRGSIRGGGGSGGRAAAAAGGAGPAGAGGSALILNFPTTIDNTSGSIWGGGGGGEAPNLAGGGGGGAGTPAGSGGLGYQREYNGSAGTATTGGAAGAGGGGDGGGGGLGAAGGGNGGRGGYSVVTNGNAVSWIAIGDRRGAVV